jgi:hypothetical protein
MINKTIIIIIGIVLLNNCNQPNNIGRKSQTTDIDRKMWVIAKNGLYLREKPSISGKSIWLIPFGEEITTINNKKIPDKINGINGNWLNVKYKNKSGWSFDTFLNKVYTSDNNNNLQLERFYGSYKLYGLNSFSSNLDAGTYSLLFYKNNKITFIDNDIGLKIINEDIVLFQEIIFFIIKENDVDMLTAHVGNFYVLSNGKLRNLSTYSQLIDDRYSSPSTIDGIIYAWGFDIKFPKNLYAISIDIPKNRVRELLLTDKANWGSDDRFAFDMPIKINDYIIYKGFNCDYKVSLNLDKFEDIMK